MNDIILLLHQYNPYLIILTYAVAGIWGLILFFMRHTALTKSWRVITSVAVGLSVLQGLLGLIMILQGKQAGDGQGSFYMHYVYGAIAILGIPLVWVAYSSNTKNRRWDVLVYSIAVLFLAAIAFRGWSTGY